MPCWMPPSRASTGRPSPDQGRRPWPPRSSASETVCGRSTLRDARTTLMGQVRAHERRRIRCVVPPAHRRTPGRPGHRADEPAVPPSRLAAADRPVHGLRVDGMGTNTGAGVARSAARRGAGRHRDDGGTAADHPGMAAVPDHPHRGRRGRGGPRQPDPPAANGSGGGTSTRCCPPGSRRVGSGRHEIQLRTANSRPTVVHVCVIGGHRQPGIVSDIDDTLVVTHLPRPLIAAWNTFVLKESTSIPGSAPPDSCSITAMTIPGSS